MIVWNIFFLMVGLWRNLECKEKHLYLWCLACWSRIIYVKCDTCSYCISMCITLDEYWSKQHLLHRIFSFRSCIGFYFCFPYSVVLLLHHLSWAMETWKETLISWIFFPSLVLAVPPSSLNFMCASYTHILRGIKREQKNFRYWQAFWYSVLQFFRTWPNPFVSQSLMPLLVGLPAPLTPWSFFPPSNWH